ncbi:MAG: tetratricopeptide repeat protein [Pirellulales bacterium]
MLYRRVWTDLLAIVLSLAFLPTVALAENEGLEDLDKAIEGRLDAKSLSDVSQVIEHFQAALNKGLDEENTTLAKNLLSITLMQRATALSEMLFEQKVPAQQEVSIRMWSIARSDLQRVVKIDPTKWDAHYLLGRLEAVAGNQQAAAKSLDAIVSGDAAVPASLRSKALVLLGDLSTDEPERLKNYQRALALDANNVDALRSRASLQVEAGRIDKALADLDQALTIDPDHVPTIVMRGRVLSAKKEYDAALKSFNLALERNPKQASIYAHRGQVHRYQGDAEAALADYDRSLELEPRNTIVLLLRAEARQLLRDTAGALTDVEKAMQLRPGFLPTIRLRAEILAAAGKLGEAIDSLKGLAEARPKDVELRMQLGRYYLAGGNVDRAIETFQQIVGQDAKNWEALRLRGDAELAIGKQAEAIVDYEAAVALKPDDSGLLNNLAWVLATSPHAKLRNGQRAVELAKRACKLTGYQQPHILSTLAATYAETGQFNRAIEWSQKAVDLGKDGPQAQQLAKELASYRRAAPWRETQSIDDQTDPDHPVVQQPDGKGQPIKDEAVKAEAKVTSGS